MPGRIFTFLEFAEVEVLGGILLLLCTLTALIWANSIWSTSYFALWNTTVSFGVENFALSKPLLLWINEGLMAVFFFIIGLEIKREILVGELSSPKKAAFPISAAVGGMFVPAGIYSILNVGTPYMAGWGVPMATDIAFALGVLVVLGKRIPEALRIFIISLAITDDIGAILVIALFYTDNISFISLLMAVGFLTALVIVSLIKIRNPLVYVLLGVGAWLAFLESGIHATVCGVLVAMTIPARRRICTEDFLANSRKALKELENAAASGMRILADERQKKLIEQLEDNLEKTETPLQRLERTLHPWATFLIMPLFALANAGVMLKGDLSTILIHPVSLGIILGLIIGKSSGIVLFARLAVWSGIAESPSGVKWRQIYGASLLGGIGFTMSLFIAHLAFGSTAILSTAKTAILVASAISGFAGWIFLRTTNPLRLKAEKL